MPTGPSNSTADYPTKAPTDKGREGYYVMAQVVESDSKTVTVDGANLRVKK